MYHAQTSIKPKYAIILYSQKGNSSHRITSSNQLLPISSFHRISDGIVQKGSLLDKTSILGKLKSVLEHNSTRVMATDFLPDTALIDTDNIRVWYQPSVVVTLWFRIGKTKSMRRTIPSLIWFHHKSTNKIIVKALGSDSRPTMQSTLFNVPFMNCYIDGTVCWGSRSKRDWLPSFHESATAIQNEFFVNSSFTHNGSGTSITVDNRDLGSKEVLDWWLSQKGRKVFDYSVLTKSHQTINDLIGAFA
jgi:PRTRC genetic system protein B